MRYTLQQIYMIKTFRHKGLERFFREGTKAGIQAAHEGLLGRDSQRELADGLCF